MTDQLQQITDLSQEAVQIHPATDREILAYLRRSARFAEIAAATEREALVINHCNHLGIEISDDEWQTAGDAFRLERKLWGNAETMTWLQRQRITVEEWSEGIKVALLEKKLKEHLFGLSVDGAYISDRDRYRRVALSQILVTDLAIATKIINNLREKNASFCSLALEYSLGKQSRENGGFVGVQYLVELAPEIIASLSNAETGEIIGPIQTKLGYHILRVEKWFPTELNQAVREQIMNSLFEIWLYSPQANHSHD
ncbi:peptidylprolyl isomerase [Calothrix sp. 336/3]|uniref:peptidylprolyl isomerase n=1 Tax=Calothrix sp. 336/3 TaxID=1337936 RepID=UPI0004E39EC8|nr:peptidylprolyl isomerase [Calothrix sp. 336/3]AKG20543.1 peptidylprolyl isomerase [Calothrix sp. 336/3]